MVKYMNIRNIFVSFLALICLFILPTLLLASDETLTITTYYPSPYGVYNEMRAKRIAVGDDYISNADYVWEATDGDGGQVDYLADLVVEGNVGIGTTSPAEKLEVSGNIKLSGASATYKITNVANPTAAQDVATKAYVDAAAGGGGCYVSYSGSCLTGFTNKGSAGSWGVCTRDAWTYDPSANRFLPAGGTCPAPWSTEIEGTAAVCCM